MVAEFQELHVMCQEMLAWFAFPLHSVEGLGMKLMSMLLYDNYVESISYPEKDGEP